MFPNLVIKQRSLTLQAFSYWW